VKLTVRPLTPERWPDLEAIFTATGRSVAQCSRLLVHVLPPEWCPTPAEPSMSRAERNKSQLKALVDAERPPGTSSAIAARCPLAGCPSVLARTMPSWPARRS
jgi:hypothetical protein